jgi:hypothetical protein
VERREKKRLDGGHHNRHNKFYALVAQAHKAIHSLRIHLDYRSIQHGVGEPPRGQSANPDAPRPQDRGVVEEMEQ